MATYAEYLKSNGATEDEIKVLDTPVARRAFDALQSKVEAESAARIAKEAELTNYDKWYQEKALPEYKAMETEYMKNASEAARYKAMVEAAQKQGLIEVEANAAAASAAAAAAAANPPAFNEKEFIDRVIIPLADKEGDAIALASDIAFEHRQLFPDKPLNFRELRRAALAARKPVEQYWMETFGVQAARQSQADAARKAHEDSIRKEERDKVVKELADKYGNPDARPPVPSTSPFTQRPEGGRDKQPWEASEKSNERVQRVTQKLIQTTVN